MKKRRAILLVIVCLSFSFTMCIREDIVCFESEQHGGSYVFYYDNEIHDQFGDKYYNYDSLGNLIHETLGWKSDTCYTIKALSNNDDTIFFCNYADLDHFRGHVLDIIITDKSWIVYCSYPTEKKGLYEFEITKSEKVLLSTILDLLDDEKVAVDNTMFYSHTYITWIYSNKNNINRIVNHYSHECRKADRYIVAVVETIAVNHIEATNKSIDSISLNKCRNIREMFHDIGYKYGVGVDLEPPPPPAINN